MKIISFAETTPALLAGVKTVTRREWAEKHALSFKAGELVQAWNKGPRVKGAKRVGTIRLTAAPYLEPANSIPPSDWEREGFAYMERSGLTLFGGSTPAEVFNGWKNSTTPLWVVRFVLVKEGD